jgi:hypothetical protein
MIIRVKNAGLELVRASAVFHKRAAGEAGYGKPQGMRWMLFYMFMWLQRSGVQLKNIDGLQQRTRTGASP